MDLKMLSDGFVEEGKSLADFSETIKKLSQDTHVVKTTPILLKFISSCAVGTFADKAKLEGKKAFVVLKPELLDEYLGMTSFFKVGKVLLEDLGNDQLIEELDNTTQLVAIVDDEKYLIGQSAMPQLLKLLSLGGSMMVNRASLFRNLQIADAARTKVTEGKIKNLSFVVREGNCGNGKPIRKVVSVFANYFSLSNQCNLVDVCKYLITKGATFTRYKISTEYTEVLCEFPAVEGVIPGIAIITSDTGFCSYTTMLTLRVGETYSIYKKLARKHTSEITYEDSLADVKELLAEMKTATGNITKLSNVYLPAVKDVDISTEEGSALNYEETKKALDKLVSAICDSLPAKTRKGLVRLVCDEVESDRKYSVMDLVISCLSLPEKAMSFGVDKEDITDENEDEKKEKKVHPYLLDVLRENCGKVADTCCKTLKI